MELIEFLCQSSKIQKEGNTKYIINFAGLTTVKISRTVLYIKEEFILIKSYFHICMISQAG